MAFSVATSSNGSDQPLRRSRSHRASLRASTSSPSTSTPSTHASSTGPAMHTGTPMRSVRSSIGIDAMHRARVSRRGPPDVDRVRHACGPDRHLRCLSLSPLRNKNSHRQQQRPAAPTVKVRQQSSFDVLQRVAGPDLNLTLPRCKTAPLSQDGIRGGSRCILQLACPVNRTSVSRVLLGHSFVCTESSSYVLHRLSTVTA